MKNNFKIIRNLLCFVLVSCILSTSLFVSADVGDNMFSEAESNNTTSTADRIYTDYTVSGYVSNIDMDYFKFTISQTSVIVIAAVSTYSSLKIGIFNTSNEVVGVATYDGYSNNSYKHGLIQTLNSGTYYILLLDENKRTYNAYTFYFQTSPVTHTHNYTELDYNSHYHWYKCSECDKTSNRTSHYGGTATYTQQAICTVCGQPYGELLEMPTPSTPSAPTLSSKTTTSVTLDAISGYEYRMNYGNWQTSNVFTGLTPNTEYSFYQRVAETSASNASEPSDELKVKTYKTVFTGYVDVKQSDWYYEAVKFVSRTGYFSGYSDGTFGPASGIARQDFVVVLARIAGADLSQYSGYTRFEDVDPNSYYAKAVHWASDNRIATGYSHINEFGVNDTLNREQLATILRRYVEDYKGIDSTISSIDYQKFYTYRDYNEVSFFAVEGVRWAIAQGIITGMNEGKYIAPTEICSRAQVAQMLLNIENNNIW